MSTLDPRALRDAFGSFMTGVTVVTTRDVSGSLQGFTANSFSSVSLDPPQLLVCPGKFLSSYQAFSTCTHFAVNILAEGQEEISNTFAGFKGDRFGRAPHRLNAQNIPLIDGAIAQFSCVTRQVIPAGDHAILIGEVLDFAHTDGGGLGYAGGKYFSLGLERAALESKPGVAICGAIIENEGNILLERTAEGFRPPHVTLSDRSQLRHALHNALAGRGITAELGPAYSVFDDSARNTHFAYFLGALAVPLPPDTEDIEAIPLAALDTLSYDSPATRDMLHRYAREARAQNFSLYLGNTTHGDTHRMTKGA